MTGSRPHARLRGRTAVLATACCALAGGGAVAATTAAGAASGVVTVRSRVTGSDGASYSATNHLTDAARSPAPDGRRKEWLLVWAGDSGPGDSGTPDPDFLAVVDATRGTPDYGKVVNTVTIGGKTGNEPHHMQYTWRKGDRVYAGGIFSDTVYVFDVSRLPMIKLTGITLPEDTPCGSAPDAVTTLADGTAYATFMGGPNIAGPCTYTHGETRLGNGFAGTPGEIVRLDRDGRVLTEAPAATGRSEGAEHCPSLPPIAVPTCANPHGLGVREDLGVAVASDFAEPRLLINPEIEGGAPNGNRDTVRVFDIADRDRPRLRSVSRMPDGPRQEATPFGEEPRGIMETTVTHRRGHRGAFASSMPGGTVYYAPDITVPHPQWREVFDDYTAFKRLFPTDTPTSALDGGGWLQVSPDDRFLYHVVLTGGLAGSPPAHQQAGMIYTLDIRRLLAAGPKAECRIDTLAEVAAGGTERDCPALVSALELNDPSTGGPHWAAMDNFRAAPNGLYRETDQISRIAVANYMLFTSHLDGDHKVCMVNVDPRGELALDTAFRDETTGAPCLEFDRPAWPHGAQGPARPHGVLFTVADQDLR